MTRDQNTAQNALTAQSQYTDRYTKAVDQLGQQGTDRLQIRLGGIYALERLIRDSPRDQPTIIEVLSAFIRITGRSNAICPEQPVAPDIQAAVTVLARRDTTHDNFTNIDLHGACLRSVVIQERIVGDHLSSYGILKLADLTGADLADAKLRDTDLTAAQMTGANFEGAILNSVTFDFATLDRANFNGAEVSGGSFVAAHLNEASLTGVDLRGVDLTEADLNGADLTGTQHNTSTLISGTKKDGQTKGAWW